MRFVLAAPEGYGFDPDFLVAYRQVAPQGCLMQEANPIKAVAEADAVRKCLRDAGLNSTA